MISSINKCVHFNNLIIIFDCNDIKYISDTIKLLKARMFIIALLLRLLLNNVFYIINIK